MKISVTINLENVDSADLSKIIDALETARVSWSMSSKSGAGSGLLMRDIGDTEGKKAISPKAIATSASRYSEEGRKEVAEKVKLFLGSGMTNADMAIELGVHIGTIVRLMAPQGSRRLGKKSIENLIAGLQKKQAPKDLLEALEALL